MVCIRKEFISYFSETDISYDLAILKKCSKILFCLDEDTLIEDSTHY